MRADELSDDPESQNQFVTADFQSARSLSESVLPFGELSQLVDAGNVIRQEFLDWSKWKRLHCCRVSIFAERDRGTVYIGKALPTRRTSKTKPDGSPLLLTHRWKNDMDLADW